METILGFLLDVSSTETMGLVCKGTTTEESTSSMYSLRICIRNKNEWKEIAHSKVRWGHLIISTELANQKQVFLLLEELRPSLKRLEIRPIGEDGWKTLSTARLIEIFLRLGPECESFHWIGEFHGRETPCKYSVGMAQETLKENLKGLTNLHFQMVHADGLDPVLEVILPNCPNLSSLTIPHVVLMHPSNRKIPEEDFFARPPLDAYLEMKMESGGGSRICFGTEWFSHKCPLNVTTTWRPLLSDLAEMCHLSGTRFANVPAIRLPNHETLTSEEKIRLNEIIESILLRDRPNGFQDLYVPPGCEVGVGIVNPLETDDYSSFFLPKSIQLVRIHLNCTEVTKLKGADVLVSMFLSQPLPTLTELHLDAYPFSKFGCLILSNLFTNLKILSVSGVPALYVSNLLKELVLLEDLTLEDCVLDDYCFLDVQKPILRSMKNLRHLRLIKCSMDGLTDAIFYNTLVYLWLKTFIFTLKTGTKKPKVTFADGMWSLIGTPMVVTLETFDSFVPEDSDEEEMNFFRNNFLNLKNFSFHDLDPNAPEAGLGKKGFVLNRFQRRNLKMGLTAVQKETLSELLDYDGESEEDEVSFFA